MVWHNGWNGKFKNNLIYTLLDLVKCSRTKRPTTSTLSPAPQSSISLDASLLEFAQKEHDLKVQHLNIKHEKRMEILELKQQFHRKKLELLEL